MNRVSKPFSIDLDINQPPYVKMNMRTSAFVVPVMIEDSCSRYHVLDGRGYCEGSLHFDVGSPEDMRRLIRDVGKPARMWATNGSGFEDVEEAQIQDSRMVFRLGEKVVYEAGSLGAGTTIEKDMMSSGVVYVGRLSTIGTQIAALCQNSRSGVGGAAATDRWIVNTLLNVNHVLSSVADDNCLLKYRFDVSKMFDLQPKVGAYPFSQVFRLPLVISGDGRWFFPEPGDAILSAKQGKIVWRLNNYFITTSDQGHKILADQTYVNQKGKVVRCTSVPAFARGTNVWPKPANLSPL